MINILNDKALMSLRNLCDKKTQRRPLSFLFNIALEILGNVIRDEK